jgi:hypothetical protein
MAALACRAEAQRRRVAPPMITHHPHIVLGGHTDAV